MFKKAIFLATAFILVATITLPALAQDSNETAEAGLTPDSPFYFLDDFWKSVRLTFTRNPENKTNLRLKFAQEKIAEVEKMTEEKKDEAVEKALGRYQEQMEGIEEKITELNKETAARIAERIANATSRHFDILEEVGERVPDRAQDALRRARDASENGYIEALRAMSSKDAEKVANMAAKALERKVQLIEKFSRANKDEDVEHEAKRFEKLAGFAEEFRSRVENQDNDTEGRIRARLEEGLNQHEITLRRVLSQVPDQAKEAIRKALEKSQQIRNPRPLKEILKRLDIEKGDLEGMFENRKDEFKDVREKIRDEAGKTRDKILDRVRQKRDGDRFCIQVITPAKNPHTGKMVEFPTPCDVPSGWEIIRTNSNSSTDSGDDKRPERKLIPQILRTKKPAGINISSPEEVFAPIQELVQ